MAQLLEYSASKAHEPAFGLRLGARQGLDSAGALGTLMCMQSSLADALAILQRNLDFHARGASIVVDSNPNEVNMRLRFAFADTVACEQLTALSMAVFNRSVAQLHRQPITATRVQLAIARPPRPELYEAIFNSPVVFNAVENSMHYPPGFLQLPVEASSELRDKLSRQWRGDWQAGRRHNLIEQVDRAIVALLPTGQCDLLTVAGVLDKHPRSLQIALKANNSSYGQLLRAARLRLATHYLANSDMDLTRLAMHLGFSELAAFSRAFKSWTGLPPKDWRAEHRE